LLGGLLLGQTVRTTLDRSKGGTMRRILLTVAVCAFSALASTALAADFGISADKLLIIDKTAANGTAKVIFVSHDPNVSKGSADDAA
jgi:hypothetical protein